MIQTHACPQTATDEPCGRALLTAPFRRLRIYSPVRSIDNILLTDDLQQSLSVTCVLVSDPRLLVTGRLTEPDPAATPDRQRWNQRCPVREIVLIDCRETAAAELQPLLRMLSTHTACALYNLSPDDPHERLIEWPQIKGMFYLNSGRQQLLKGLGALMGGDLWLPRQLCHNILNRRREPVHPLIADLPVKLTRREREALEGLYAGKNNNALAHQLKLSEHTVKSHLYSAYKKIGVKSRLEASNWLREYYNALDQLSSG